MDSKRNNEKTGKWIQKEGYETCLLANGCDMATEETEVQLVKFNKGKYKHYHKKKTEFFYFLEGHGWITINGAKRKINPGTSLLVPPGVHHEFVNEVKAPLIAIMFKTNSQSNDTYTL